MYLSCIYECVYASCFLFLFLKFCLQMIKLTGTTNPFGLQFCDQLHSRLLCLSVLQRLNQRKRCRCFQQERKGRTRESSVQTQTDVLCEYNTGSNTGVLVINALLQACMWCLVVLLMCDLCGGCVPTRSALEPVIYTCERGLGILTFSLAERRGDRQTDPQLPECVCWWLMW